MGSTERSGVNPKLENLIRHLCFNAVALNKEINNLILIFGSTWDQRNEVELILSKVQRTEVVYNSDLTRKLRCIAPALLVREAINSSLVNNNAGALLLVVCEGG
ncbi:hypothetical protein [Portibacter lacus]|uniref:hypothetical protein n=1 Tax=Portibacter lacus TaxID=1099794 RepID=UPI0024E13CD2|nr:hypothetical protein [Portibacter lacus]